MCRINTSAPRLVQSNRVGRGRRMKSIQITRLILIFNINKKFEFKHGKKYLLPDNKTLIACYHPSPRNVNTKIINHEMINLLFRKAKKIARF